MKILHIVRQFSPSIGGLEDYVLNLSLEQKSLGHEVGVFTLNTNFQTEERLADESVVNGVPVKRFAWFGSKRYPITRFPLKELNKFDIVHVHAVDFFIDYLSMLKRVGLLKAKLVLTTHGGFFHTPQQQALKKLFFKTITRFTLRPVDVVFTISNNDKALFEQIKDDCHLIENGVAYQKFGHAGALQSNSDFVYLGRLSSNKRLDWLIEAFSQLAPDGSKLKIIGNRATGDAKQLEELVISLHAQDRVELLFNIDDEAIREHIESSRYVISASEYEGFGLSVIELMSYGLVPFLSSQPDSFKGFISQSGVGELFTYEHTDFEASYLSLVKSWSVDEVEKSKQFAERFSWKSVARSIVDGYAV
ncbi:glycosyltransferase family 4 protein [Methylophaga sp. OBS3]|uniref:glycosyltransferase family 4 protein n=1 Tax=Methylophaga sp. OBS3 TaxID=2991934 RepID=UPI00225ACFBE|nr:glycosyltransferase family 4 protein [Methylophaga sp. OBS3]MCX4189101.1 glycosyltransferase family 4 protein [Methylophaga sp. OBS3]